MSDGIDEMAGIHDNRDARTAEGARHMWHFPVPFACAVEDAPGTAPSWTEVRGNRRKRIEGEQTAI